MGIVNIKFRNTALSLESDNESRVMELSEKLNQRAELIAQNSNNITDTKLAVISALMLEDQMDSLNSNGVEQMKSAFVDSISQLADYLERLADRIEKR